ncbi:MAG: hypothetical protein N3B12_09300, partial [Armatimonadetes bacterium]|nr:hypothetical protein [Armatimonadota bacterium]
VLTAIASMLAVAGFIVGLNWNTTEWTDENRLSTQKVMFDILHLPLPCDLPEAHSRLQKLARYMVLPTIIAGVCLAGLLLWNKPITGTALEIIGPAIIVSVLILPSFLLDRTVKNWEERKSGQRIVTRTNNHQETDDNNSPNY